MGEGFGFYRGHIVSHYSHLSAVMKESRDLHVFLVLWSKCVFLCVFQISLCVPKMAADVVDRCRRCPKNPYVSAGIAVGLAIVVIIVVAVAAALTGHHGKTSVVCGSTFKC